jgi:N-acetylglutamate synthase-like GNAT family acetyltransferase
MDKLNIEKYSNKYESQVQQLIIEIQSNEFQLDIDLDRQPDLNDISNFYQQGLGNFWVALINEKVVGTISLLDIGNRQTALRKMFVDKNYRGKEYKVGQQLLDNVIEYSKIIGVEEMFLGTTEKFIAAQKFYEKNNFIEIEKECLPKAFPIMDVDVKFYKFSLQKEKIGRWKKWK